MTMNKQQTIEALLAVTDEGVLDLPTLQAMTLRELMDLFQELTDHQEVL